MKLKKGKRASTTAWSTERILTDSLERFIESTESIPGRPSRVEVNGKGSKRVQVSVGFIRFTSTPTIALETSGGTRICKDQSLVLELAALALQDSQQLFPSINSPDLLFNLL